MVGALPPTLKQYDVPKTHPFTRAMRMRSQRDFTLAYRQGSRARGRILVVVARANGLGITRLGLSVGRKIWKSAVRRNRLRRVFREAFRLSQPDLPAGVDFILIPAEPRLETGLEPTQRELQKLAHKAWKRYCEKQAQVVEPATDGAGQA